MLRNILSLVFLIIGCNGVINVNAESPPSRYLIYDEGAFVLTSEQKSYLDTAIVLFLEQDSTAALGITGHSLAGEKDHYADSTLAALRLIHIYSYLTSKGVHPDRIYTTNVSSCEPALYPLEKGKPPVPIGRSEFFFFLKTEAKNLEHVVYEGKC